MMQQTKLTSLIEAITNTLLGFVLSMLAWPVLSRIAGIDYNGHQHMVIVLLFTVLSVVRGYVVRRFFNNHMHHFALTVARLIKQGKHHDEL